MLAAGGKGWGWSVLGRCHPRRVPGWCWVGATQGVCQAGAESEITPLVASATTSPGFLLKGRHTLLSQMRVPELGKLAKTLSASSALPNFDGPEHSRGPGGSS